MLKEKLISIIFCLLLNSIFFPSSSTHSFPPKSGKSSTYLLLCFFPGLLCPGHLQWRIFHAVHCFSLQSTANENFHILIDTTLRNQCNQKTLNTFYWKAFYNFKVVRNFKKLQVWTCWSKKSFLVAMNTKRVRP